MVSTEAEQDAHLTQFIQNGGLNRAATYGIGDYIPGYNNLNPAERELVKKHPVQATKVFTTAQSATDYTISTYGKNGWQDNSDAFRHCLWNALMKKAMDASAAEEWATAHEYESSGLDKSMDLFNNSIGRSIVSVQISKTCSSRNGLLSASVPGAVKTSMRARKTSTAGTVAVSS